ncbi:hypothetical protein Q5752_003652 [Cryptotrichosporon argae]
MTSFQRVSACEAIEPYARARPPHTLGVPTTRNSSAMRAFLPLYLAHAIVALSHDTAAEIASAAPSAITTAPVGDRAMTSVVCSGQADLRRAWMCGLDEDGYSAYAEAVTVVVDKGLDVQAAVAPDSAINDDGATHYGSVAEPDTPLAAEPADADFVSFEEWKRIRGEADDADASAAPLPDAPSSSPAACVPAGVPTPNASPVPPPAAPPERDAASAPVAAVVRDAPRTHGRYNYASPDCSARIHSSSPETQHAASLLHKSRDRYMLTPCRASEHWAVVELCDEIRVEAVELAVWEFFSGVVREIVVSVGGEDDDEGGGWERVGTFTGKNVRGAQTFVLPEPTSFHRFLRIDFPSYYGNEYYCPVSQLKVYGMNQMEAFKWEQRRSQPKPVRGHGDAERTERDRAESEQRERARAEDEARAKAEREREEKEEARREKELGDLERLVQEQMGKLGKEAERARAIESAIAATATRDTAIAQTISDTASSSASRPVVATAKTESHVSTPEQAADANDTRSLTSPDAPNGPGAAPRNASTPAAVHATALVANHSVSSGPPSSHLATASSSSSASSSAAVPSSSVQPAHARPATRSDASESIYAHIVRRLSALEGNSTLVARYVEEQGRTLRAMLAKAEGRWEGVLREREVEERGRWEREQMRNEDRLGRIASQVEAVRVSLDHERRATEAQLRLLSEELGYERRRSLVQLFVLIITVVLGVLTRIDAIDAVLRPLLADARRRRSLRFSRADSSRPVRVGPLAGLRIDIDLQSDARAAHGTERPMPAGGLDFASPTPKRNGHAAHFARGNSGSHGHGPGSGSGARRPATPTLSLGRRRGNRSISEHPSAASLRDLLSPPPRPTSPGTPTVAPAARAQARPRVSLPPPKQARRLARSAHLHPLEGRRESASVPGTRDAHVDAAVARVARTDAHGFAPVDPSRTGRFGSPLGVGEDDWGTEDGTSASEVEDEVFRGSASGASEADDEVGMGKSRHQKEATVQGLDEVEVDEGQVGKKI